MRWHSILSARSLNLRMPALDFVCLVAAVGILINPGSFPVSTVRLIALGQRI